MKRGVKMDSNHYGIDLSNLIPTNEQNQYEYKLEKADKLQKVFQQRMERIGFDLHGIFREEILANSKLAKKNPKIAQLILDGQIKEQVQNIFGETLPIYYTAIYSKQGSLLLAVHPDYWGAKEEVSTHPNFVGKRKNGTYLQLKWHKFAFQEATSTEELTPRTLTKLFNDIEKELKKMAKEMM